MKMKETFCQNKDKHIIWYSNLWRRIVNITHHIRWWRKVKRCTIECELCWKITTTEWYGGFLKRKCSCATKPHIWDIYNWRKIISITWKLYAMECLSCWNISNRKINALKKWWCDLCARKQNSITRTKTHIGDIINWREIIWLTADNRYVARCLWCGKVISGYAYRIEKSSCRCLMMVEKRLLQIWDEIGSFVVMWYNIGKPHWKYHIRCKYCNKEKHLDSTCIKKKSHNICDCKKEYKCNNKYNIWDIVNNSIVIWRTKDNKLIAKCEYCGKESIWYNFITRGQCICGIWKKQHMIGKKIYNITITDVFNKKLNAYNSLFYVCICDCWNKCKFKCSEVDRCLKKSCWHCNIAEDTIAHV